MRIDRTTLTAFADELVKLAVEAGRPLVTSDLEKLKEHLKPGDIINTAVRPGHEGKWKLFVRASQWFQKTPYTHSTMYVGDGKIVNIGTLPNGEIDPRSKAPVVLQPLDVLKKHYDFKVLRPIRATWAERKNAVEWMKQQQGKVTSTWKIVRNALLPDKTAPVRERAEPVATTCSELVANAYPGQPFAKGKDTVSVIPVDIEKSPLTKTVLIFKGQEESKTRFQKLKLRLGSH